MQWIPPYFLVLSLYVLSASCESYKEPKKVTEDTLTYYLNPVFEPTFADPSIVKDSSGYYAYATQDYWENKDHLIPVIYSENLVDWEYIRDAFLTKPSWKQGGLWAPNVFQYDSRYFMFYSLSTWGDANPGIGLAVSDSPGGTFIDRGKFFLSSEVNVTNSIDPFFFEDPVSGDIYIFWGSFHGIYGQQLNYADSNFTLTGTKFQIAGNLFEGTYIYYKDGFYYYFGSCGSCCDGVNSSYHVRVGRSISLQGPYLDPASKSLLSNTGDPGKLLIKANIAPDGFAGPGHNGEIFADDRGDVWLIYHAIEKNEPYLNNGATRRPLMIDRLKWFEGWPMIDYAEPSMIKKQVPEFQP